MPLNERPDRGPTRATLSKELLDALSAWNPREWSQALLHLNRGLSLIHVNVLAALDDVGPIPMGRLADVLDVSVASATGIVDRMEKRGLVERMRSEEDRRVVLVRATDAGLGVFDEMARRRREGLTGLLDALSEDEMRGFLAGLRALHAARARAAEAHAGHEPRQENDR